MKHVIKLNDVECIVTMVALTQFKNNENNNEVDRELAESTSDKILEIVKKDKRK